MPFASGILETDLDRMFDLWGEAVTYQTIEHALGLYSGIVTATAEALQVTAIRSASRTRPVDEAAGHLMVLEVTFRIRTAELVVTPKRNDRVIDATDIFEVAGWDLSPDGLVWKIHTTRI